ncbi:magnesium-translocating P-type ATPase [Salmonella enterica subsp. enterica serovar Rubislaw]|uniref:magnesium-translocating P-type ATPase n=2 Tax=Salmonella enterica TaxID=28901 RepID=UPI00071C79E1|nr:magnesium-translocating P-type ATPase [Salmonella enterica]EBO3245317.1 magnesium-translocating P-type ATPase [Salmonella enterica subsp. enterica serovar Rubislaw]EHC8527873.1 magnesium-translocating P-type ATPase [Salmonella enterica subsp. enterica serovar 11:r:-]ECF1698900.1 magnesium-translocating P-type ATPase [Salmonella enterica subsp. enterica serovar Rubislaw]EGI6663808.1 magnesium-translocating P-type ATPase [Salmonella enterica subsp. enterica serovar Rubislaw]EHC8497138.1 magne
MTDMKIENRRINRSASENDKQHKKSFAIETEAFNSPDHTLARLNSSRQGLTAKDALERLDAYGRNEVAHEQAPPALIQLLQAFNNPFIYVLMALAAVSFVTDYWLPLRNSEETDLTGIIIIVTMVSLSGLLRFWQEFRTNKAAQALKSMVRTTATVLRRGPGNMGPVRQEIAIEELMPGDIIFLAAGDLVPADVRLLESRDLFVSQSILSGESLPVEKYDVLASVSGKGSDRLPEPNKDKSLLEMGNICLMGTNVTSGRAQAVVVATGNRTWFGSLAKSIVGTRTQTAFDRGVNSVSWLLIRFMLVMVPIVLLINGFSKGDWVEASLFALAVAVGLTPEMLPMIVSSNLAKGAIAMSRRKVIVKRLNAIQNFGAMDVLCTDKTGTLTQDNIILEHHLDVSGHESDRVLTLAWLNSSSQSGARNLMDRAVLRFGEGRIAPATKERFVKLDELPFDFVRRRVSVSVEDVRHGDKSLICKGAVEEMLMVATHLREGDNVVALDETRRDLLLAKTKDYNTQGFRVLLVATRKLDDSALTRPLCTTDEQGLTVEGMLTFLDPPKESAGKAITALRDNGVAVKVLTGDNPVVTARICLEVGIDAHGILTGTQIEAMTERELEREVEMRSVFAKLTPLQKSRILKTLQKNGHTVGFLGDGINDAPALRDADVGISVDSAADIAKEASDIILLEKDLMVLEEGVIKGRETFGNIIKYLNMTASSNFGNVFSVLVASAFIPFLPMLAIHLLIQNLMYDLSQLSLPWDKMDKEFLRKPRKWDAKNIGRFMLWIGPTSSIFDITTFALMWFVFAANNVEAQALFQSGWFIEGLLSQTLVVHMLRTQKIPFIQSRATLPVLLTTAVIMAIGIYIPFSPLGAMVGLEPLPLSYFPWLAATLLSYCLVAQGMKRFYIKRFGQWF